MPLGDTVTKGLDALFAGQPDVLSIDDVATLLNRSKATIYRWVKSGVIPSYRVGKEWMILSSELRDALEKAATPAPEEKQEAEDDPEDQ